MFASNEFLTGHLAQLRGSLGHGCLWCEKKNMVVGLKVRSFSSIILSHEGC